jgi:hypothetical protein
MKDIDKMTREEALEELAREAQERGEYDIPPESFESHWKKRLEDIIFDALEADGGEKFSLVSSRDGIIFVSPSAAYGEVMEFEITIKKVENESV